MSQIKVRQLLGLDIAGLQAITTQPQYRHMYERDGITVPTVTLTCIETKRVKNPRDGKIFEWLYLRWDGKGLKMPWACGFSGWREDVKEEPVIELL